MYLARMYNVKPFNRVYISKKTSIQCIQNKQIEVINFYSALKRGTSTKKKSVFYRRVFLLLNLLNVWRRIRRF